MSDDTKRLLATVLIIAVIGSVVLWSKGRSEECEKLGGTYLLREAKCIETKTINLT